MHNMRIMRDAGNQNGSDAGQPPAATPDQTPTAGGQDAAPTFTQEQVNQFLAKERKNAEAKGASSLLSELGYTDPEELRTAVLSFKTAQEAQMTELQKAQARVKALETADAKAISAEKALETANAALKANVESQLKALNVPKHISTLVEAMEPIAALDYLTANAEALRPKTVAIPDIDAKKNGGSKSKELDDAEKARIRASYGIN
jgi:hypothetical protein